MNIEDSLKETQTECVAQFGLTTKFVIEKPLIQHKEDGGLDSYLYQVKIMSEKQLTKEELLAKAEKPAKDALKLHPFYQGKIQIVPKCSIWDFSAFGVWYVDQLRLF